MYTKTKFSIPYYNFQYSSEYLSQRQHYVHINNTSSPLLPVKSGVHHGGILGFHLLLLLLLLVFGVLYTVLCSLLVTYLVKLCNHSNTVDHASCPPCCFYSSHHAFNISIHTSYTVYWLYAVSFVHYFQHFSHFHH